MIKNSIIRGKINSSKTLMYFFKSFLIILPIFFSASTDLQAQEITIDSPYRARLQNAVDHLKNLKKGTLVFVVVTNTKKLRSIEKILANPNISRRTRRYYEKEKLHATNEANKYKNDLPYSVKKYYNYSDYAFIRDTSLAGYKNNTERPIYNDKDGNHIAIKDLSNVYFFVEGRLSFSHTGVEVFAIKDSEMNYIVEPFPGSVKKNTLFIDKSFTKIIDELGFRLVKFGFKNYISYD